MLSLTGSSPLIHVPIFCTHLATFFPLMKVRVIATLHIGDWNPGTPWFAQKYDHTSSKKLSALAQFPSKVLGMVPMVCRLAAEGTGTWAGMAALGIGAPLPPPLPPPPHLKADCSPSRIH